MILQHSLENLGNLLLIIRGDVDVIALNPVSRLFVYGRGQLAHTQRKDWVNIQRRPCIPPVQ